MLKSKIKILIGMLVFLFAATVSGQDDGQNQSQTPQDQTETTTQDQTGTIQDQSQMQQDEGDQFSSQVDRLSSQLNLSEEQSSQINTILNDYHSSVKQDVTDDARTSAQAEADAAIVEILDENQRIAYQSMSPQWWNDVNSSIDAQASQDAESETESQDTEAQQPTDDDQQY